MLPKNDPLVAVLERAATMTGEVGSIGATSIDFFPICAHARLSLHLNGCLVLTSSLPLQCDMSQLGSPNGFLAYSSNGIALKRGKLRRPPSQYLLQILKLERYDTCIVIYQNAVLVIGQAAGGAEDCFVSKMLDDYEVEQRDDPTLEDDIRMLGAVSYAGMYVCLS